MTVFSTLCKFKQYLPYFFLFLIILISYNYYSNFSYIEVKTSDVNQKFYHNYNDTNCKQLIHKFELKTNLKGVNYQASHWFHIAENFLTNHVNSKNFLNVNKDNIIHHYLYNFDNEQFIDQLNGMTRLFIALGTIPLEHLSYPLYFHFVYLKSNNPNVFSLYSSIIKGKTIKISRDSSFNGLFIDTTDTKLFFERSSVSATDLCFSQSVQSIGGKWPTIQRGHWFPSVSDVQIFRKKLSGLCMYDDTSLLVTTTSQRFTFQHNSRIIINNNRSNEYSQTNSKFRLVIYQRDKSRRIQQEQQSIDYLYSFLPRKYFQINVLTHNSDTSPCVLAKYFSQCDILITAHGFQSMLLLFLPPNAILYEVFPFKYYKRAYGPLSKEYGIVHAGVMSSSTSWLSSLILSGITTDTCMKYKICRNYARNHDVRFTKYFAKKLYDIIQANKRFKDIFNDNMTYNNY